MDTGAVLNRMNRVFGRPAADVAEIIRSDRSEKPTLLFCRAALETRVDQFVHQFPGIVSYAVKANPDPRVLKVIASRGVAAFDVASPFEIDLVRRIAPKAALHYHNPAKSRAEIAHALRAGVTTYSVDSTVELGKIATVADECGVARDGIEISVRFRLAVSGAAYDFGAKFGADLPKAVALLGDVVALGMKPSLTFHPGTQCEDPAAWVSYIEAAARIAREAGVRIGRLNVGGGFPAMLYGEPVELAGFFRAIGTAAATAFGDLAAEDRPVLVCEPGRGMVGDAGAVLTRVKLTREDGAVFLNDGIYGLLDELAVLKRVRHFQVFDTEGRPRTGAPREAVLFGPTCDSMDQIGGIVSLPCDIEEGDHILFLGLGAYSLVTGTGFNGYGAINQRAVLTLETAEAAEVATADTGLADSWEAARAA